MLSAALRAAQFDSVGDYETKKREESSGKLENKTTSGEAAVSDATCKQVEENNCLSASEDNISDQSAASTLKSTVSMHCAPCLK